MMNDYPTSTKSRCSSNARSVASEPTWRRFPLVRNPVPIATVSAVIAEFEQAAHLSGASDALLSFLGSKATEEVVGRKTGAFGWLYHCRQKGFNLSFDLCRYLFISNTTNQLHTS